MILNSIKIKNITSLKGQTKIDFEKLSEFGPFAITGPTGSGKSSILNCITLALYGQTYKKTLNQSDYVSLGEKEGKIELTFTYKKEVYTAHWQCKVLKNDGTPIKNINAKRFYYKNNELVDINIEEVLNLNFDQFCKTVILNQGMFSEFINSSFSKRRDILEKLYSEIDLTKINSYLNSKLIKYKNVINKLESITKHNLPFDEDEVTLQKNILEKTTLLIQEKDKEIIIKQDVLKHLESYTQYYSSISSWENRILELKCQHDTELENVKKISIKNDQFSNEIKDNTKFLDKYKTVIEKYNLLKSKLANINNNKVFHEKQKNIILSRISEREREKNKLNGLINEYPNKTLDKVRKIDELVLFNSRIDEYIDNLQNLTKFKESIISKKEDVKEIESNINSNQIILTKLEKERVTENVENCKIKIQKVTKANQDSYSKYTQKKLFLDQNKKLQNEFKFKSKNLENLIKTIKVLEDEMVFSSKELKVKELESEINKKNQIIIKLLNDSENECPICDSHIGNKDDLVKKYEEEIILSNEEELNTLKKQVDDQKSSLIKLESEKSILENSLVEIQKKLDELNISLKSLDNIEELLSSSKVTLENLNKDLEKYYKEQEQYHSISEQSSILRNKLLQSANELKNLNSTHISQSNKLTATIAKIETIYEIDLPANAKDVRELKNIYNDLYHKINKIINISNSLNEDQLQINDINNTINDLNISINETLTEIKKLNLNEEIMSKYQLIEKRINKDRDELKDLENKKHKIELNIRSIKTNIELTYDQIKNTNQLLLEHKKKLKEYDITNLETDFLNILIQEHKVLLDSLLKEKEDLKTRIISIQSNLKIYNDKLEKNNNILKIKEKIIPTFSTLEDLKLIFGKDEFRNFVLASIENSLIDHANLELKSLCQGRYRIISKPIRNAQEYFLEDSLNFGLHRKISTLSGGETFLISLAMSLALSTLTRGNTRIDSFIIDEGFGTLDTDSLNEVKDILMDLESTGKQIGIISHIKELTDNFPVNLNVIKDQFGVGKLNINYN